MEEIIIPIFKTEVGKVYRLQGRYYHLFYNRLLYIDIVGKCISLDNMEIYSTYFKILMGDTGDSFYNRDRIFGFNIHSSIWKNIKITLIE